MVVFALLTLTGYSSVNSVSIFSISIANFNRNLCGPLEKAFHSCVHILGVLGSSPAAVVMFLFATVILHASPPDEVAE